ncbi:flagellar protein FlaG [Oceanobacillus salinisoli]|uniref:flagellar protein FlaG n=1 Tax=Oceanobacillus salinisoli TaxID=2678611 RepID=UPI0012E24FD0|nr:flagellar protein FlaG [Oceanobacillus salinisoli]
MSIEKVMHNSQPLINLDSSKEFLSQSEKVSVPNEVNVTQNNERRIEKDDVEKAVSSLNDFIKPVRKNIKFEMHEKLERYYVTVIDSDSKEVLKEIPPKKLLDMYAEMADFMGFLIDKKV